MNFFIINKLLYKINYITRYNIKKIIINYIVYYIKNTYMSKYYSIEDLSNKEELLGLAYEIAKEGIDEYPECTVKDIEYCGSFKSGTAELPDSDLDFAVYIEFDEEKAEFPIQTTIYTLESQVYPSLQHKVKNKVNLNISKVDFLVNPIYK